MYTAYEGARNTIVDVLQGGRVMCMAAVQLHEFDQQRSSVVRAMAYDRTATALYVQFWRNDAVWRYQGVSEDVFVAMLQSDSIGSFLAKSIKKQFGAAEVDAEDWARLRRRAGILSAEERAAAYEKVNANLFEQLRKSRRALGF
jgi:hypothetical protein